MGIRRVVTGNSAEGKSVFVSDEDVDPITLAVFPGAGFLPLWAVDGVPTLPPAGSMPNSFFPPTGGVRVSIATLDGGPNDTPIDLDQTAGWAEVDEKLPGMLAPQETDGSGMHTTQTVDVVYILEGEVVLELDDGAEVVMRAGDVAIQQGTRHAWRKRNDQPMKLLTLMVGAEAAPVVEQ
jgi:mannose-6-phosphate isomerase-like protein (cupin superfamily)